MRSIVHRSRARRHVVSMQATRLVVALILAFAVLVAPLAAPAQQPPEKTARIGFLGDVPAFLDEAFRQGLRELGYVEGQNIAIEHRAPDWKYERLPALAADLVRLKVDVIVAASRHTRAHAAPFSLFCLAGPPARRPEPPLEPA